MDSMKDTGLPAPSGEDCTPRGSPESNLIGSPGTCAGSLVFRGWAKNPNQSAPIEARAIEIERVSGGVVVLLDAGLDERQPARQRSARVYLTTELLDAIARAR